jgi:hypothetical protein
MVSVGHTTSSLDKALDPVHYAAAVEARLAAPADEAFAAALAVTLGEMRLSSALMMVRSLPRIVTRRQLPRWGSERPFLEALVREPGFLTLVEPADGFAAFGYLGRPWKPAAEPGSVDGAEGFVAFEEPGWAKVVMDLSVRQDKNGSVLRTKTRIHLTDESARRAFARYWGIVKYGSNAIRWDWFRAARRRAEP